VTAQKTWLSTLLYTGAQGIIYFADCCVEEKSSVDRLAR
jgi:hypothetical protein